jgi:hypothetical protein
VVAVALAAEQPSRAVADTEQQPSMLSNVARALADVGRTLGRSVCTSGRGCCSRLPCRRRYHGASPSGPRAVRIGAGLVEASQFERAVEVAAAAAELGATTTDPVRHTTVLAAQVRVLVDAGHSEPAIATAAAQTARRSTDSRAAGSSARAVGASPRRQ